MTVEAPCRQWGSTAKCPRAKGIHQTAATISCVTVGLVAMVVSGVVVHLVFAEQPPGVRFGFVAGAAVATAGFTWAAVNPFLRHLVRLRCCTYPTQPATDWRLIRIGPTQDDGRYLVTVYARQLRQKRSYELAVETPPTDAGVPVWGGLDWYRDTVYDAGAQVAVVKAAQALHNARQREITLPDTHHDARWRLSELVMFDDLIAILSDQTGKRRDFSFRLQATMVGGYQMLGWDASAWESATRHDRDAFTAVMDAVVAFHAAQRRNIALGNVLHPKPSQTPNYGASHLHLLVAAVWGRTSPGSRPAFGSRRGRRHHTCALNHVA